MQAAPNNLPLYSLPILAVFVAVGWCLILISVSVVSGWHQLARKFSAISEPYGEANAVGPFFYSVYLRFCGHYGSVIRMVAARDALYLSVLLPFRPGHPPLCIPWNEIKLGRAKMFWRRYIVLTLGEQERIPMRISERMARNLGILDRIPN